MRILILMKISPCTFSIGRNEILSPARLEIFFHILPKWLAPQK